MTTMLPAEGSRARSLAALADEFLETAQGRHGRLGLTPVSSTVIVIVDGVGTVNLAERAGHARFLSAHRGRSLRSPIPSTTAASLPTILTGRQPGAHGMLGYRIRDPHTGRIVNQLTGWDDLTDPEGWQRATTIFEQMTAVDIDPSAVGPAKFATTGFTRAVLRGARYVPADRLADRVDAVVDIVHRRRAQFVYLYIPELDKIAHKHGWNSDRWIAALETVDSEVARLHSLIDPRRTGVVVSADHGIVDVPAQDQVLYDAVPRLLDGVEGVGGEPRFLQLYARHPDQAGDIARRWRDAFGDVADIGTREEAIAADWYGDVHPDIAPRVGDVVVAARSRVAFYDGTPATASARAMIGQHGGLSDDERNVPFIRLGAWA